MACPLCGDRCTCSFAPATASAGAAAPPSLTYEYEDDYGGDDRQPRPAPLARDSVLTREEAAVKSFSPALVESAPIAPPEDLTFESARVPENEEPGPMWKQELTSRLENYRARRGSRRPRYNENLSLDFDRAVNRMIASALAAEDLAQAPINSSVSAEPAAEEYRELHNEYFGSAAALVEREAAPEPAPAPTVATNVLEFPRLPTLFDMAPTGNELAEPVVDKPRILYVPEEVPTAQAPLADIQINPEEPPPIPDIQLPIAVAPMGQRVLAALIDGLLVLAAVVVFMAVVLREVPAPDSKLGYMLVAALPVVFWAIYEYLFLVHCAATPGMRMAHLAVRSFDHEPVGRRLRRARALAWMLSAFPLGLGIVWALLDEDTLCWHDRITRTYLVEPIAEYED